MAKNVRMTSFSYWPSFSCVYANQTLVFLKRNVHNKDLKSGAYKTLVRPQLEYAFAVWSPNITQDTDKIESAQRKAARWVTRDYRQTSCVK